MKRLKRWITLLLVCLLCVPVIPTDAGRMQEEAEKNYENETSVTDSVSWRKEKAKELELESQTDEEGYLVDAFYENKSDKELEEMGVHGLIRSVTEEELEAYTARLHAGIMTKEVTKYQKIQEGYDITGIFEVDGKLAYCVEHSVATPAAGSPTGPPVLSVNDMLRKVLYYGYNGPADLGIFSYVQTAMGASQANGNHAGNTGKSVYDALVGWAAPPSSFKVWIVTTNQGTTQDLAYYTEEESPKTGTFYVAKGSSNTSVTVGNGAYTLGKATYGIYSNRACSLLVKTVTTGDNGISNPVELSAGTYYVKETTPPKGYALSAEVKQIEIQSGQRQPLSVQDAPQGAVIPILLQKTDAETTKSEPQETAVFKDAQFAVKYYKGEYGDGVNPAETGKTPERQWIFRTDEKGKILFSEEYKVSGDDLWKTADGKPMLPLGTITVQEVKPPEGYHLNPEIFIRKITANGTGEAVSTYQQITVPENILKLELIKVQEESEIPIPKAEFEHTRPDGTTERRMTDSSGKLVLKGLQKGTHQIKEISVMDGYLLNGNPITFTITENNTVTFLSEPDISKGNIKLEVTADGNIKAVVEDLLAPFSIIIHKKNEKNVKLKDAEFTLYENQECTKEAGKGTTDEDGLLRLDGLKIKKTYYLKETKAPQGYRLPTDLFGNPVIYELYAESSPTEDEFVVSVNGKKTEMAVIEGTKAEREVHLTVENRTGFRLPNTGSEKMFPMLFGGCILCAGAVLSERKRRKKE